MLIYAKFATAKTPKKRSRAGCIYCKERKKKCNEKRPECDRCTQRGLHCQYESLKTRSRSFTRSDLSNFSYDSDPSTSCEEQWFGQYEQTAATQNYEDELIQKWEANSINNFLATYSFPLYWDIPLGNDTVGSPRREPLVNKPLCGSSVCLQSQYPDVMSPILGFNEPVFREFTDKKNRRPLMEHFCNVLSTLIVFKDTGNPFKELILPLAYKSSPIMNAILALASAHLEYKGIENMEKSLDFHNRALQGLAQIIDQGEQANKEEVLSTIMLLVYYEALVSRGNSNFVDGHLKGAITIMKSGLPLSTPTMIFLERALYFFDVIAALSLGTPPSTNTPPKLAASILPIFSSSLPDSQLSKVDALLGAAIELWPTIHRLSQMLSLKTLLDTAIAAGHTSKASILRTEIESTAHGIELALAKWKPQLPLPLKNESGAAETFAEETSIQGILNNAEAYRHSAFVYLYRTIRLHPRSHLLVQKHAHLSLIACSNVARLAEQYHHVSMPALLWPLFVAACEATTEDDRELATDAFIGMERRQGMRNIMRAWEVVQEVWRRADFQHCGEVHWRDVCEERGFNIAFG